MRTLGIDLASSDGSTGVCEIDWVERTGRVAVGRFADETLTARLREVTAGGGWAAIDAPFGFPVAFSRAVHAWDTNGRIRTESDHRIRRRLTDEYVAERQLAWKIERKESRWNPWPLSSVVDLITPSVIRCARILTELNGLDAVDRIGFRSRVVEAYPIAALRLWGVPTYNYKRTAADCGRILDDLSSRTGLARPTLDAPVARGRDDDAVDAFVCALVARAVANASGGTGPEGAGEAYGSEVETIRREGWIHLPFKGEPIEALAIGSPPVQQ